MTGRDIWRLLLLVGLAAAVGLLMGHFWAALAVGLLGYVAWLHHHLFDLLHWLRDSKNHAPAEPPGVFEEITLEIDYLRERHKKRKKKLASYLRQFQQATRALPDATVVLDVNGAVMWANEASAQALGIRWPEDMNQRITNLLRLPKLQDFVVGQTEVTTIEIASPTDQNHILSVLLAPYGKDRWLFVARDVTQLHRATQIRSDFVANVSHELRTPTTVIKGFIEALLDQRELAPPSWLPALEQMSTYAERMQLLIEELLLLSKLEHEDLIKDPRPLVVAELLVDIVKQAQTLSGPREHQIRVEADAELQIAGTRSELSSAFSNLVFNAVNYTPAKGVIQIRWFADETGAHLEVQDNGTGISAEHLDRITERFYRIDQGRARKEGGTGLGLAIVKHVLLRHSAQLHVTSTLGEGSLFHCDFPLSSIVDTASHRARLSLPGNPSPVTPL